MMSKEKRHFQIMIQHKRHFGQCPRPLLNFLNARQDQPLLIYCSYINDSFSIMIFLFSLYFYMMVRKVKHDQTRYTQIINDNGKILVSDSFQNHNSFLFMCRNDKSFLCVVTINRFCVTGLSHQYEILTP